MFIESNLKDVHRSGWIEIISGSMFSGKTEELIRRLRRATIAHQNVLVFKPAFDDRFSNDHVVSHNENALKSIQVASSVEIFKQAQNADVIGIDEAQFFDDGIVDVCNQLANKGTRIIVSGLDLDFRGDSFGPMPKLLAIAEFVTKVHAICIGCGDLAHYSHRTTISTEQVLIGAKEAYEPLCRRCFGERRK